MAEIYAYLYGDKKQTLRDHVFLCLKAFERIKDTKIWDLVEKICGKTAEKYMRIAIVFHDSGKVLYQRNFKQKDKIRYLSFYGHEIYSAYFVGEFFNAMRRRSKNVDEIVELEFFKPAVIASVLYHHHAMGVRKRMENLRGNIAYDSDIVGEFDRILEEVLDDTVTLSDILKDKTEAHLSSGNISGMVNKLNMDIWQKFASDGKFGKIMLLFTDILLIVDYEGSKERDNQKTEFAKVLEEFVELYSKP